MHADHHFELAATEGVPEDASSAFRYIVLFSFLCSNSSPIGALPAPCRCMLCVGQPLAFRLSAS
jgi:hypothetical protein